MGNPQGQESMYSVQGRRVSGGSFPAQVWHDFMAVAMANQEALDWPKPPEELTYTILPPPPRRRKRTRGRRQWQQGDGQRNSKATRERQWQWRPGGTTRSAVPYLDYAASAPLRS